MASLHDESNKTISQLFENITNDAYEKYKTSWDKSPWKYFRKLSKESKLEITKLFISRLCSLCNIQIRNEQNTFYIHKKSFKIYLSISPNNYGVYQSSEHYVLGQCPWKIDYLMFINVYPSKIYISFLKNFTESYYRITSVLLISFIAMSYQFMQLNGINLQKISLYLLKKRIKIIHL